MKAIKINIIYVETILLEIKNVQRVLAVLYVGGMV